MPKKNQIKFRDFEKAVANYLQRHFPKWNIVPKSGSGIRYELFSSLKDQIPHKMWVVHQDTYVHKGDLKKTCQNLGITLESFIKFLEED